MINLLPFIQFEIAFRQTFIMYNFIDSAIKDHLVCFITALTKTHWAKRLKHQWILRVPHGVE